MAWKKLATADGLSSEFIKGDGSKDSTTYADSAHVHTEYANSSHNHSADDVTSGTLPISRGGTGATIARTSFDNLAPTTTAGDIIYYNGSNNARLPKGSAGQVLTMNSGATAPEWAAASGGGGGGSDTFMEHIHGYYNGYMYTRYRRWYANISTSPGTWSRSGTQFSTDNVWANDPSTGSRTFQWANPGWATPRDCTITDVVFYGQYDNNYDYKHCVLKCVPHAGFSDGSSGGDGANYEYWDTSLVGSVWENTIPTHSTQKFLKRQTGLSVSMNAGERLIVLLRANNTSSTWRYWYGGCIVVGEWA